MKKYEKYSTDVFLYNCFFEYKSNVFAKSCFDFLNSIFYLSARTSTRFKFPIENTVESVHVSKHSSNVSPILFPHEISSRNEFLFRGLRVCCVGGEKKVNAFSRRAGEIKGRFVRSKEEEVEEK